MPRLYPLLQPLIPPPFIATLQKIKIWLVVSIPLKHIKVSWEYYSQYMENEKMFHTTNQKMCGRGVCLACQKITDISIKTAKDQVVPLQLLAIGLCER